MSQVAQQGGDGREPVTASAIATLLGGELIGAGDTVIHGIAALDRANGTEASLLSHRRYEQWFRSTNAGVVVVDPAFRDTPTTAGARIIVAKPLDAMLILLPLFHRPTARPQGVHATAIIHESVSLGADVTVEAFAVIDEGVVLGDGVWIGAHAVVGARCRIGRDSRMYPQSCCYPESELGERVVLHAGARVGREGFGWVPRADGAKRIPHVGRCILGNDVEIGANSCVDRGSIDDTIIGAGTKIDSLVQVAHNVRIGRMCMIASQVGIAGSTRVDDGVMLGGQVGLAGHLRVGSGASIGAQGGVVGDVPAGETWSGYPARPHREQLRASAALHRLPALLRPLEELLRSAPSIERTDEDSSS